MSDAWWDGAFKAVVSLVGLYLAYKLNVIGKQTDGLTKALVKTTGDAEHAKGKIEGAAEQSLQQPAGPVTIGTVEVKAEKVEIAELPSPNGGKDRPTPPKRQDPQ